jgi:hypothetical protein
MPFDAGVCYAWWAIRCVSCELKRVVFGDLLWKGRGCYRKLSTKAMMKMEGCERGKGLVRSGMGKSELDGAAGSGHRDWFYSWTART